MPKKYLLKLFIFIFTSLIFVPSSYAVTARLHNTVSLDSPCPSSGSATYTCSPKSSGYALRGIFGLFGVGYASTSVDYGLDASTGFDTFKVSANAFDISLSFLDALITVGVGSVIGGSFEAAFKYNATSGSYYLNKTMKTSDAKMSGSTSFLNLGFDVGPVELIAGYRMWDAKATGGTLTTTQTSNFPGYTNGTTTTSDSGFEGKWNELTIGFGFGF